jgi:hypothetical protein
VNTRRVLSVPDVIHNGDERDSIESFPISPQMVPAKLGAEHKHSGAGSVAGGSPRLPRVCRGIAAHAAPATLCGAGLPLFHAASCYAVIRQ